MNDSTYKLIPLTKGKSAKVSPEDYEWLTGRSWHYGGTGYAQGSYGVYMHREIVKAKPGQQVDHINGDKLDNRRSNLRVCNQAQNNHNQHGTWGKRGGYKGVYRHKRAEGYYARIKIDEGDFYLGSFTSAKKAARVYDAAALYHFGDFASTNFSDVQPESVHTLRGRYVCPRKAA